MISYISCALSCGASTSVDMYKPTWTRQKGSHGIWSNYRKSATYQTIAKVRQNQFRNRSRSTLRSSWRTRLPTRNQTEPPYWISTKHFLFNLSKSRAHFDSALWTSVGKLLLTFSLAQGLNGLINLGKESTTLIGCFEMTHSVNIL